MKDLSSVTELIDCQCGSCGGTTWKIYLGHCSDGTTTLSTICANEECVEARRQQLGVPHESFVVWDEFDITGQGRDAIDMVSEKDIN